MGISGGVDLSGNRWYKSVTCGAPIDSGIGGLMVLGLLILGKIDRMSNAFRMMFNK